MFSQFPRKKAILIINAVVVEYMDLCAYDSPAHFIKFQGQDFKRCVGLKFYFLNNTSLHTSPYEVYHHQVCRSTNKLNQSCQFRVFENVVAFNFGEESFAVHCDPIRLEFGLVDTHVIFGYHMVVQKNKSIKMWI